MAKDVRRREPEETKGLLMGSWQDSSSKDHDALTQVVRPFQGQELTRTMLATLIEEHPELQHGPDWVRATDHCRNRTNKGACRCAGTDEALFEWVDWGLYRVRQVRSAAERILAESGDRGRARLEPRTWRGGSGRGEFPPEQVRDVRWTSGALAADAEASAPGHVDGSPVIVLPEGTRHHRKVVDHCEWRIRTFVERDAYIGFDYEAGWKYPPADSILRRHLAAINGPMRARSPVAAWAKFFGRGLPELRQVPYDLDLIDGDADEVEQALTQIGRIVDMVARERGITDMAASKVLHLFRPRLVAISDSYVRMCLGIPNTLLHSEPYKAAACVERFLAVQRAARDLGRSNQDALDILTQYANALPPLPWPPGGRTDSASSPSDTIAVRLSKVRVLDILLSTEIAIHGRIPNKNWVRWYQETFGDRQSASKTPSRPHQIRAAPHTAATVTDYTTSRWQRMNRRELVQDGEQLARQRFTSLGLRVLDPTPPKGGPFFLVRTGAGREYSVRVRSLRGLASVYLPKASFELRDDHLCALLLFLEEEPRYYLIPGTAWRERNRLFVSRDYPDPGLKSLPEWGLNLSQRNLGLLDNYQFDAVARRL